MVEHRNSKSLGLPMVIGRSKRQVFGYLTERINKKLNSWKTKLLNDAGKEVMIKAVVQALPVYSMSVFKLPLGVCNEISKCTASFWWNKGGDEKKIHWICWPQMTKPKEEGGLGLKDVADFNQALLAKQVWRLMTKPNLLLSRIMKAKYYPHSDVFQAKTKPRDSWMWQSWNEAKALIQFGSRWRVGNGHNIKIWEDNWFNEGQWGKPFSPKPENCTLQKVHELLNPSDGGWNQELLNQLFTAEEVIEILKIPVSTMGSTDRLIWMPAKNGQFNVTTGYKMAQKKKKQRAGDEEASNRSKEDEVKMWDKVWQLNIKMKLKHFLWKACHDRLPVGSNLKKRGLLEDDMCRHCGEGIETIEHVFFHCAYAKSGWKLSPVQWDGMADRMGSFKEWWLEHGKAKGGRELIDRQEFTVYLFVAFVEG